MTYDEMYHHGILGQKWGVRRYQNADGTLTPAGKIHYQTTIQANTMANEVLRDRRASHRAKALPKQIKAGVAGGTAVAFLTSKSKTKVGDAIKYAGAGVSAVVAASNLAAATVHTMPAHYNSIRIASNNRKIRKSERIIDADERLRASMKS